LLILGQGLSSKSSVALWVWRGTCHLKNKAEVFTGRVFGLFGGKYDVSALNVIVTSWCIHARLV